MSKREFDWKKLIGSWVEAAVVTHIGYWLIFGTASWCFTLGVAASFPIMMVISRRRG